MVRKATCCCKCTTVIVDGEPDINGICHCGNCQKRTGSAFGWSAYFAENKIVEKSGNFSRYPIQGENEQERFFCKLCGTTVFWVSKSFSGMIGVAGGCFVDDPLPSPNVTVSNDGQHSWVTLPPQWKKSL